MNRTFNLALVVVLVSTLAGCTWFLHTPVPAPQPTVSVTVPPPVEVAIQSKIDPDRLISTLQELTQIQAYSGWRTSATEGEKEGLDFVKDRLQSMDSLVKNGLKIQEDRFRVFLATEIHQASLTLDNSNGQVQIPVNGLRGARDNIKSAMRLDSDGNLNDIAPNPVTVSGELVVIREGTEFSEIAPGSLEGKIVFIEYGWVDTVLISDELGLHRMKAVINGQPEGIVLATTFSNQPGISHGTFAADLGVIATLENEPSIPTVLMRLEDLPDGSSDPWDELAKQHSAEITWDTDVLSPAESGNLIARIPGKNHEKAVLLSAHIDSANSPGALDDGSGAAILLEIAAVVNEVEIIPAMDVYLVWYGSEEIGLLGSANFTASHQEIIDQLVGMLNIDCLSRPVDGAPATLNLAYGSGSAPGDTIDPWANYLISRAALHGIDVEQVYLPLASDNSSFAGYNTANLDLIYDSDSMMQDYNGVWFAGHLHDPYDEVALVKQVQPQLLQMTRIALDTALTPDSTKQFRQKSDERQRVLFISSHNEDVLLTPAALFDLGLAFENAGLDVDVIPYGQNLSSTDLENLDLAIALPVFDLPQHDAPYDEAWSIEEIDLLKGYVNKGGALILTNTARRVKYYNTLYEDNEDWEKMNALANGFEINYQDPVSSISSSSMIADDRLTWGINAIYGYEGNSVPFTMRSGKELAKAGTYSMLGVVDYGGGTVIALSDIGILSAYPNGLLNPQLVENIIDYTQ